MSTDFFERTGKVALGSRLRVFADMITSDDSDIYAFYGVDMKPKWFPVLSVLAEGIPKTITGMAQEIGQSHPSVSGIVKEMSQKGLIKEVADENDRRRNRVTLSPQGMEVSKAVTELCKDVRAAVESVESETHHDLWRAIDEWEMLLSHKSLLERVKTARKKREGKDVTIIPYTAEYAEIFRELNEQWITQHWELEEHDLETLGNPDKYILNPGGHIFIALYKGMPVGVCALCKMNDAEYDYELAKLVVAPVARGKGIGKKLCLAAIGKARSLGADKIFLESNTILKPAIALYRSLGFKELSEYHPAYARGDIQMELSIKTI